MEKTAVMRFFSPVLFLLGICITPAFVHADSIDTKVTCYSGDESPVSGANTCSVSSPQGFANDTVQLSVIHAVSASDYTTVLLSETGVAHGGLSGSYPGLDAVQSSASLSLTLLTAGPERTGYIEVATPSTLDTEWGFAHLDYSIGSQTGFCYFHTSDCTFGNIPPVPSLLPNRFFAVTLGDPFTVQLTYSDRFSTDLDSYISPIQGQFELQFRFFESDTVTPVALNPEPATWKLFGAATLAAALFGVYRRLRKGYAR